VVKELFMSIPPIIQIVFAVIGTVGVLGLIHNLFEYFPNKQIPNKIQGRNLKIRATIFLPLLLSSFFSSWKHFLVILLGGLLGNFMFLFILQPLLFPISEYEKSFFRKINIATFDREEYLKDPDPSVLYWIISFFSKSEGWVHVMLSNEEFEKFPNHSRYGDFSIFRMFQALSDSTRQNCTFNEKTESFEKFGLRFLK
jgi:hypothetical protein